VYYVEPFIMSMGYDDTSLRRLYTISSCDMYDSNLHWKRAPCAMAAFQGQTKHSKAGCD